MHQWTKVTHATSVHIPLNNCTHFIAKKAGKYNLLFFSHILTIPTMEEEQDRSWCATSRLYHSTHEFNDYIHFLKFPK